MLTSLPVELIHKICEPLISWRKTRDLHLATVFDVFQIITTTNPGIENRPPSSLGNLRLVCRDVNAVVTPLVFSEVVFDFCADVNRRPDASLAIHLECVARGRSPLCHSTKTLKILSLCPTQMSSHNGERRVRQSLIEENLQQHLEQAVSCMKNLRHIYVEKLTQSDMKYFSMILPRLSALPLEHLSMNFVHFDNWDAILPIPVNTTSITKLKLVLSTDVACSVTCAIQIRNIILTNSHITDLDIQTFYEIVSPHHEELLVSSSLGVSPLRTLRHLSITHGFLPQEANVIKHLTALKSLRLYGMDPSFPALWDNLTLSHIWLEELQVDSFSRPLLEYISSFSGLKKLRMVGIMLKTYYLGAVALEHDAVQFFKGALRSHQATLTSVCVEVTHWHPFCFRQEFADTLASCPYLMHCSLTLDYDQGVEKALQIVMTSFGSRIYSERLGSLALSSVTTTHKLDFPTAYWQLKRKQACAVIRSLRSFEIRDRDRYPKRIHLPQIEDVPLLVMTDRSNQNGVFKYVEESP